MDYKKEKQLYKLSILDCNKKERVLVCNSSRLAIQLLVYWHNRVDTLSAVLVVC